MIQCSCPECGYRYKVADELAGKRVLWPECQTRFKVKGTWRIVDVEEAAIPAGKRHPSGHGFAIRMPYVEHSLLPGEQVVHCGHIDRAALVRGALLFLVGVMFFFLGMVLTDRRDSGIISALLYSIGFAVLVSAFSCSLLL